MEKYPSEMAADFRHFYGLSLWDIPKKVCWAEAIMLFRQLIKNTESLTLAAINQYTGPFNRTDMVLMDIFDLTYAANSAKKADRYKRPWEAPKTITKGSMPLDKAIEFFSRLGHK